ncbi:hypothetical protein [Kitasatospora sp. NPDC093806]|uniref:hypothetical protein n=1 Tax=Kitasatospora sp. NPDC093806 TaxID=3155075 RepID=UPI00342192D9
MLDDPRAPRLCVVGGQAGTGKTHLLTWLATACSDPAAPSRQRPDVALSLAGMTVDSATWTLAARLGVYARTLEELAAAMAAADRPRLLFLWDLNRSVEPEAIAEALVGRLLDVAGLRIVMESAGDSPAADGAAVLSLDDPRWTDPERFASWYARAAAGSSVGAERVYPNPGLALLAARIPPGNGDDTDLVAAWWAGVAETDRAAICALAAAVRPVTEEEWSVLAAPASVEKASAILPTDSRAGGTWWLPPGPLRTLVAAEAEGPLAAARAVAVTVPRSPDGAPDLTTLAPERRDLLLRQAVAARVAGDLLDDLTFLAHTDPLAVTAAFAAVPDHRYAPAWRAAGPSLFAEPSAAARREILRSRLSDDETDTSAEATGWRVRWSSWLTGADAPVVAAATGHGPFAGRLLVADAAGDVHLVELDSGRGTAAGLERLPGVQALSCSPGGDVVALDEEHQAYVLDEAGEPAAVIPGRFTALASLPAAGDAAGQVHWLVPGEGGQERLHDGPVTALGTAVLDAPSSSVLVVSGGADGRLRAWRPGLPPLGTDPSSGRGCAVTAVDLAVEEQGTGRVLLVTGWSDGLVRVGWADGESRSLEFRLGAPPVAVVADGCARVVVVLPDGLVGLSVDPDVGQSSHLGQSSSFG